MARLRQLAWMGIEVSKIDFIVTINRFFESMFGALKIGRIDFLNSNSISN